MENMELISFYKGKRVFITGHTGFKGSWLCCILIKLGAEITGYALAPQKNHLFDICKIEPYINSIIGDIRDYDKLSREFYKARPEVVIHLAAQPLVQEGYKNPALTYETNVMGTVRLLDCVRSSSSVASVVNVTTDKVYRNEEWPWGYREIDVLDGHDPYSNSKSCSELVTHCYKTSFFAQKKIGISSCRAGNVIGGGDFAQNRIIPDCVRAAQSKSTLILRNLNSVRPYQHVLEPLFAYLLVAYKQYNNPDLAGDYNIGPDSKDIITNKQLVQMFCSAWNEEIIWKIADTPDIFTEANILRLDHSKIAAKLGWHPRWNIKTAIEKTVEWSKQYISGADIGCVMDKQIDEYLMAIKTPKEETAK